MSEPEKPKAADYKGVPEFTVEVSDARNRNVLWPITQDVLRGAFRKENLVGVTMDEQFTQVPDLPGMVIRVRPATREAWVADPLNHPKNARLLEKAQRVVHASFGEKQGPEKDRHVRDLTVDEVKNWCYWTRRLLDARQCKVISGAVPEMAAIERMPGKVRFENHDTRADIERDRDPRRYVPMRHDEAEEQEVLIGEDD